MRNLLPHILRDPSGSSRVPCRGHHKRRHLIFQATAPKNRSTAAFVAERERTPEGYPAAGTTVSQKLLLHTFE